MSKTFHSIRTDFLWLDHPTIIILLGTRGGGKSATGHYILESRFHEKEGVPCYMIAPQRVQKIIREKGKEENTWLEVIGKRIPPKSAILIDDAQLIAHARQHWRNIKLDKIISMSRHRQSTLIFSTQMARRIDVNIMTSADTLIFKQPPLMGARFERPGIKKMIGDIDKKFMEVQEANPEADMRAYSYVVSNKPRYEGFVGPTPLPSYWSEELSRW